MTRIISGRWFLVPFDHDIPDLAKTFLGHRAQLCRAARKIVGTRESAEDVMQEAFLKISQRAHCGALQPMAFCFHVVRNLAIDHWRRQTMESAVFTEEDEGRHTAATQGTPEQVVIDRQALLLVGKVLDGLPARTREAFEMHRVNGLTQRDIAAQLGVSLTLVNFMIRDAHDALARLRHHVLAE